MSLLNSASLVVTPNAYKEGTLYSVIPNSTLGDMTVVRATTATRVNSAGLIELVPYNLLQQSETFTNAIWTNSNLAITTNTIIAPNGTTTADTLTENSTSTSQYRIYQTAPQSTNIYTISVYVKNITGTRQAYIDLGPVTGFFNFASETTYSASGIASFENVGNGWYRFSLTTATAITPSTIYMGLGQSNSETYTGNGTSAIAFWGAQLVTGTLPKDYLRTETRLNIPRLDYSNGSCPSLLVEPQRSNLILYSEQFDNAAWTKGNGTITANATTSPDGTANADKFAEDTSTDAHYFGNDTATATSGQSVTFTIFAKASERSWIAIRLYSGASSIFGWYNIGSGTLGTIGAGGTGTIENYSNGWYRCSLTITMASNSVCLPYAFSSTGNGTITFTGTSGSGFFAWGAQLELGSYPTSYIPTTSAAVTRNADVISKTGISSLIGQTEGVMFIDYNYDAKPDTNGNIPMVIYDGSNEAYIFITSGGSVRLELYDGGVLQCLLTTSIGAVGRKKIAFGYKQNDFVGYMNGVQIANDTSGTVGAMSNLYVGSYYTANYNANGGINSSILFPTRLTNAELAQLTTI